MGVCFVGSLSISPSKDRRLRRKYKRFGRATAYRTWGDPHTHEKPNVHDWYTNASRRAIRGWWRRPEWCTEFYIGFKYEYRRNPVNERIGIGSYKGKSSATFMTTKSAMVVYNEADIVVYIGGY
jgi:hypothetical protein